MRIPNPDRAPDEVPLEQIFSMSNLSDDSQIIVDKFVADHRPLPSPWVKPPNPVEQRQQSDGLLEKNTSEGRGRAAVLFWLRKRMALGDSAEGLIAHAQKYDLAVANLIRELAAESL